MKKAVSLAVVLLCGYQLRRTAADWERLGQWNADRREAEQCLANEVQVYRTIPSCSTNRCPGLAVARQEQLIRLGTARAKAIRILQQKPGALTAAEARRLDDYSALFGQLE